MRKRLQLVPRSHSSRRPLACFRRRLRRRVCGSRPSRRLPSAAQASTLKRVSRSPSRRRSRASGRQRLAAWPAGSSRASPSACRRDAARWSSSRTTVAAPAPFGAWSRTIAAGSASRAVSQRLWPRDRSQAHPLESAQGRDSVRYALPLVTSRQIADIGRKEAEQNVFDLGFLQPTKRLPCRTSEASCLASAIARWTSSSINPPAPAARSGDPHEVDGGPYSSVDQRAGTGAHGGARVRARRLNPRLSRHSTRPGGDFLNRVHKFDSCRGHFQRLVRRPLRRGGEASLTSRVTPDHSTNNRPAAYLRVAYEGVLSSRLSG